MGEVIDAILIKNRPLETNERYRQVHYYQHSVSFDWPVLVTHSTLYVLRIIHRTNCMLYKLCLVYIIV